MCSRKSYEQVEVLLAARFPKPDVRDLIRRLPPTVSAAPYIGSGVVAFGPMELTPGTAPALFQADPTPGEAARPGAGRGAVKALSVDRFSVNFTADGEFRELLDEVRALLSHSEPTGDFLC